MSARLSRKSLGPAAKKSCSTSLVCVHKANHMSRVAMVPASAMSINAGSRCRHVSKRSGRGVSRYLLARCWRHCAPTASVSVAARVFPSAMARLRRATAGGACVDLSGSPQRANDVVSPPPGYTTSAALGASGPRCRAHAQPGPPSCPRPPPLPRPSRRPQPRDATPRRSGATERLQSRGDLAHERLFPTRSRYRTLDSEWPRLPVPQEGGHIARRLGVPRLCLREEVVSVSFSLVNYPFLILSLYMCMSMFLYVCICSSRCL